MPHETINFQHVHGIEQNGDLKMEQLEKVSKF